MGKLSGRSSLGRSILGVAAACLLSGAAAMAQQPAAAQDSPSAQRALAQLRLAQGSGDADTLLSLTQDGALLYEQDEAKLTGYQYCSQAVALAEQGEFRQSVRAASKALHLAETADDPELMARALRDLAIVYSYSGQLDQAESFAREALKQPVSDPQQVAGPAYKVIGDVQGRRGDHAGAVSSYEAALAASSPRYAPLVQASLVNALIESGAVTRAAELLSGMAQPEDAGLALQLQRTRARLLLAQGQPAQSRELYLGLAQQQGGMDGGYYRLWAWEGVARSEQALGNRQAAADALTQALQTIDSVRARFRSEEFKMGLFSDVQDIFEQAVVLRTELGDTGLAFEASEHGRSRALLDALRERTRLPGDAAQSIGLADLQGALRDDERVVQFHSLPDQLLVWVIGRDAVNAHRVALSADDLTRVVEAFRDGITAGRASVVQAADQLGALLLAPLSLSPGQRVIIVPHGPLHYLPFQALRLDGQYLIERNPVSVAPSGSIAARLAARSPRVQADLVAFGNPRIADEYDLPGAEREVNALSALFPRHTLYVGEQASKQAFAKAARHAPVLHVAAHALADRMDPLYSRILLANEDGRQNFLEAHEILGLDLNETALVTLSACESGLGRVAQGDEVLGFTRSFLAAGSSSLIASLWPVSDDATAVLMDTLYQSLADGSDLQRAMQAGQLAVLAQPRMSHPFFWAPFNLIGNWRMTLDLPQRRAHMDPGAAQQLAAFQAVAPTEH